MLDSVRALVDVCVLWGFVFVVCGIIAMQLWMGSLHNRCIAPDGEFYIDVNGCESRYRPN